VNEFYIYQIVGYIFLGADKFITVSSNSNRFIFDHVTKNEMGRFLERDVFALAVNVEPKINETH